jgi:hypothetical protein
VRKTIAGSSRQRPKIGIARLVLNQTHAAGYNASTRGPHAVRDALADCEHTAAKSLSESIQSIAEGKILANGVIAFQMSRGEVSSHELPLPPEALELLLTVGIFVVVEQRANIERWHFGKGVCFQ